MLADCIISDIEYRSRAKGWPKGSAHLRQGRKGRFLTKHVIALKPKYPENRKRRIPFLQIGWLSCCRFQVALVRPRSIFQNGLRIFWYIFLKCRASMRALASHMAFPITRKTTSPILLIESSPEALFRFITHPWLQTLYALRSPITRCDRRIPLVQGAG